MRSRSYLVPVCGFAITAAACGSDVDDTVQATSGFLLVSGEARAARAELEDGSLLGAMPVALGGVVRTLRVGGTQIAIESEPTVVVYVRAADAAREWLVLDGDIYSDRIAIDAPPERVASLAHELGATAGASGDGVWVLRGDDVWTRAAALAASPGVREVFPVDITSDGGAVRSNAAAHAPVRSPVAIAPAALELAVARPPRSPGAICEDPIAGRWVATTYRAADDWYEFTLDIQHSGTGIRGTIGVRMGSGTPNVPGRCDDGTAEQGRASMRATGTWSGTKVRIDGRKLESVALACGRDGSAYQLDHFTGTLRGDGVLVTVNNDGMYAFDRPYEFHRVACQ